jgi:hypothetical protein
MENLEIEPPKPESSYSEENMFFNRIVEIENKIISLTKEKDKIVKEWFGGYKK